MGGAQPAVGGVFLHRDRLAGAQSEAGARLPGLDEAADLLQAYRRRGVAPVGEHARPPHGRQLVGVAHTGQAPPVTHGQGHESIQVLGGGHPCFVEENRGALGREVARPVVVGEELGQRHGGTAGLPGQHVGGLARRGQSHHAATPGMKRSHGCGQRGGLAGAGRAHH